MIFFITLGIFITFFVFQIKFKKLAGGMVIYRAAKYAFFGSVAGIAAYYLYLVRSQYVLWKTSGPPFIYFVPPYQSIGYVFGYHFTRFLMYYVVSFVVAFLFFFLASRLNRMRGGVWFEVEEPYLGALVIFLLGNYTWNYAWLQYLFLVVGVYLFWHLAVLLRRRLKAFRKKQYHPLDDVRLPLYWFWMPVAMVVLLANALVRIG